MGVRVISVLLALVALAPSPALAEGPSLPARAVPVLFVPLTVDRPFARQEKLLRDLLSARMLATGRFVETVTAETEKQVQECVRSVNREATAETCWVRLGQGQGAEMMVAGGITGDERSCFLTIRLTVLETRVSPRKYVQRIAPCAVASLDAEISRAASVLAGEQPSPAGAAAAGATPAASTAPVSAPLPPPPVLPGGPQIRGGQETASVGNLVVEVKPFGQVWLDLTDPKGKAIASGSPYRNAQAAVGTWKVLARAQGYEELSEMISVPPDETTLIKRDLSPLGGLEVSGTPEGAAVQVTGPGGFADRRGLPWSATGLRSGTYDVQVSRAGYRTVSRQAQVRPGETTRVPIALEKDVAVARPAAAELPGAAPDPGLGRFEVTLFTPGRRQLSAADGRLLDELERMGFRVDRNALDSNPDSNIKFGRGERAAADKVLAVVSRYYRGSFELKEVFDEGDKDIFVNLGPAVDAASTPRLEAAARHRVTMFTPESRPFRAADQQALARLKGLGFQVDESPGGGGSNTESNVKVGKGNVGLGQQVQLVMQSFYAQPFPVQELFEAGDTDIYVNLGADADGKAPAPGAAPASAEAARFTVTLFTPGNRPFTATDMGLIRRLRGHGFQVADSPGGGGSNSDSNVKVGQGSMDIGQQVQSVVRGCYAQEFPVRELFEKGDTDIYVNLGADADGKVTCRD